MLKLQTPVDCGKSRIHISYKDRIMIIGSCFADNIGARMSALGFDVCVNPFGTLYNPQSICNSLSRLTECREFTMEDCEPMGSGAGLVCSFSHHTSFARRNPEDFLENANRRLHEASEFWHGCNKVIMTLGTSWCYRHIAGTSLFPTVSSAMPASLSENAWNPRTQSGSFPKSSVATGRTWIPAPETETLS